MTMTKTAYRIDTDTLDAEVLNVVDRLGAITGRRNMWMAVKVDSLCCELRALAGTDSRVRASVKRLATSGALKVYAPTRIGRPITVRTMRGVRSETQTHR